MAEIPLLAEKRMNKNLSKMKRYLYHMPLIALLVCSVPAMARQAEAQKQDSLGGDEFRKIRIGGYGEMLLQRMDYSADRYTRPGGAPKESRAAISIPRTVFALDYKFNPSWIFSTEVEFEYGGTGVARELEYDEAGEYELELEKGGEVVLEQFHITKVFAPEAQIRFGHMVVPVGLTNAYHEPVNYFGTTRPEGEMTIIPCTWHETGIAFRGGWKGLNYEAMVINGLDPNGFSSGYWVRKGKQGMFEAANFTSPAIAARLEYEGVRNLRIGASLYWNNSARNTVQRGKLKDYNAEVTIMTADLQYRTRALIFRANFIYGNLSDSYAVTVANRSIPKASGHPRTPVAKNAMNYYAEAGYDILSFWQCKSKLYPFVRYEYYNSMQDVEGDTFKDPRYRRDIFTAGINYYPLPNLVIKADYAHRRIDYGGYNNENTISAAVGYVVWFHKR